MRAKTTVLNRKARAYRVIAVSLSLEDATDADRVTDILRSVGWPKANRSLVIREALLRLQEDLEGRSPEEIFRYFIERYAKRIGKNAHPRRPRPGLTMTEPPRPDADVND